MVFYHAISLRDKLNDMEDNWIDKIGRTACYPKNGSYVISVIRGGRNTVGADLYIGDLFALKTPVIEYQFMNDDAWVLSSDIIFNKEDVDRVLNKTK